MKPLPPKAETIERFAKEGETAILLDGRLPGVDVPDEHRRVDLILKISHRYDPPDLTFNSWGFSITLSFHGQCYPCRVPWSSVYGARSTPGEAYLWEPPEEAPEVTKRRGGLGLVS